MVSGLTTMPNSNFFTRRTCAACSSAVRFLWITPMPPSCAMAIAMAASVTVSIADGDQRDVAARCSRVSRVRVSVAVGQHLRVGRHHQHVVEGERLARCASRRAAFGAGEAMVDLSRSTLAAPHRPGRESGKCKGRGALPLDPAGAEAPDPHSSKGENRAARCDGEVRL